MKRNGTDNKVCPSCRGIAILPCPWCKEEERNETGMVIKVKAGKGCRCCLGRGVFACPVCEGRGVIPQEEIDFSHPQAN